MAKKITRQVKKPRDLDTGAWYLSTCQSDTIPQMKKAVEWIQRYIAWLEFRKQQAALKSQGKKGK